VITSDQTTKPDKPTISETVRQLRSIAVHSLARMYRPEERLFAFTLRKSVDGEVLEGVSRRYTATALIGLANEDESIVAEVLAGQSREDVCGRLIADIEQSQELGEVALTAWAARMLLHPDSNKAIETLRKMDPASGSHPTVEFSWALTALAIAGDDATDMALAERLANDLISSFRRESCIFPHGPAGRGLAALRSHVSCFADFVYPIQALSHYYKATGDTRAAEVATSCAETMCKLQGPEGQWWWHFDNRTGRVIERYPVYSVHQDSMAPMALHALTEARDIDHSESIEKGLKWLANPTERIESLVDSQRSVIWRKVARREPAKLARTLQATVSRVHSTLRLPGINIAFPPVGIDYETRPYHMGWILHAWATNRAADAVAR